MRICVGLVIDSDGCAAGEEQQLQASTHVCALPSRMHSPTAAEDAEAVNSTRMWNDATRCCTKAGRLEKGWRQS